MIVLRKPICFVSQINFEADRDLVNFLITHRIPTIVDPYNHARVKNALADISITDRQVSKSDIGSVLKFGLTPVSRLWRDLSRDPSFKVPVYVLTEDRFPGCARKVYRFSRRNLYRIKIVGQASVKEKSSLTFGKNSEHAFIQEILRKFSKRNLFLGNSLVAYTSQYLDDRNCTILGNRGANGIDGLVSTFAGICVHDRSAVGIVGDLSFFYDLAGLSALSKIRGEWRLFVINNRGGRIFSLLNLDRKVSNKAKKAMISTVNIDIKNVCKSFDIKYFLIKSVYDVRFAPSRSVSEIIPDNLSTKLTWRRILS